MSEYIIVFLSSKLHIVIAVTAVVYFLITTKHHKLQLMVLGAITLPASYILGKTLGLYIETVRPFVSLGVSPLVEHAADNGFPSEHTLYALIIAGVIWMVHKKLGTVLVVLALLVGIGRVFALVHNPVDIVGSVVIALFIFVILLAKPAQDILQKIEQFCTSVLESVTTKS